MMFNEKLYTIKEAAEVLGIATSTLYGRLAKHGIIPRADGRLDENMMQQVRNSYAIKRGKPFGAKRKKRPLINTSKTEEEGKT